MLSKSEGHRWVLLRLQKNARRISYVEKTSSRLQNPWVIPLGLRNRQLASNRRDYSLHQRLPTSIIHKLPRPLNREKKLSRNDTSPQLLLFTSIKQKLYEEKDRSFLLNEKFGSWLLLSLRVHRFSRTSSLPLPHAFSEFFPPPLFSLHFYPLSSIFRQRFAEDILYREEQNPERRLHRPDQVKILSYFA